VTEGLVSVEPALAINRNGDGFHASQLDGLNMRCVPSPRLWEGPY
jgi:hypothetical protein